MGSMFHYFLQNLLFSDGDLNGKIHNGRLIHELTGSYPRTCTSRPFTSSLFVLILAPLADDTLWSSWTHYCFNSIPNWTRKYVSWFVDQTPLFAIQLLVQEVPKHSTVSLRQSGPDRINFCRTQNKLSEDSKKDSSKHKTSLGELEPPTFRLTANPISHLAWQWDIVAVHNHTNGVLCPSGIDVRFGHKSDTLLHLTQAKCFLSGRSDLLSLKRDGI